MAATTWGWPHHRRARVYRTPLPSHRALVTPASGFVTAPLASCAARTTMVGVYSMEDVVWWNGRSAAWAVTIVVLALPDPTRAQSACTESDSTAAIAIRQRLAQWVTAWNHGDADGAAEIWAEDGSTDVVGLAARGPAVTDSAAYAAAEVQNPVDAAPGQGTFSLTVEEIAATGGFAGVRDVWVETRRLPGAAGVVQRTIRGGELWQCQPDGWWRIARRYFVAPAPWVRRTAE